VSTARVLLALSSETPAEVATPVEAALTALDLEVHRVDLGRISGGTGVSVIDRVAKALLGEVEHRRLEREIAAFLPDVAVALDPGAAAALVRERDRAGAHATPVVAIAAELAPRSSWAVDADRYVAIDDEAAVALGELGVDGARVVVCGAPTKHAFASAALEDRAALRARFKLPADEAVVLVEAARLPVETLSQLVLQLALLDGKPALLFEAGDDPQVAAQLRRQVPPLGLRAKLFGDTADAPLLWRAADVVVARPRTRAILQTLVTGAAFIAIEPHGEREIAEARALEERGIGASAKVLLVAASLGPLCKDARVRAAAARAAESRGRPTGSPGDAADAIATLVRDVAVDREAVLAETRAAAAERAAAADVARESSAAAEARRATPPGDLEDLGGFGDLDDLDDLGGGGHEAEPGPPIDEVHAGAAGRETSARRGGAAGPGLDPAALARLRLELDVTEARLRKELLDVRADAERWSERRVLAERKGDLGLAAEAGRAADRKRARMHVVLEDIARVAAERQRLATVTGGSGTGSGGPAGAAKSTSIDDELEAMKRTQKQKSPTVEDELAALKRKMHTEKKK
jgi:UDP-N-acetylglucosamine:LPS N-acetylglucosamine transferase